MIQVSPKSRTHRRLSWSRGGAGEEDSDHAERDAYFRRSELRVGAVSRPPDRGPHGYRNTQRGQKGCPDRLSAFRVQHQWFSSNLC